LIRQDQLQSRAESVNKMNVYSTTNFIKNQASIFNGILKHNEPVEITINNPTKDGANQGLVIVPKSEYQEFMDLKSYLVEQANQNVFQFAMAQNPKTLTDPKEIENWMNED